VAGSREHDRTDEHGRDGDDSGEENGRHRMCHARAPAADPGAMPMLSNAPSRRSKLPVQKFPKDAIRAMGTWMA
jgi:hypothetical protein